MTERRSGKDHWCALAISILFLGVFVFTAAPDVLGGDSGEFQFVPYILGIPHHTGYPLFTLLGKLWAFLPIGDVAYRMNLLSALFAAMAVGLSYLIVRELGGGRIGAVTTVLALGTSELFWFWGTRAGVRSSTVFFAALVIYLAVRLATELKAESPARRELFLLALANGAALAHHRSAAFLSAATLVFLLLLRWRAILCPTAVAVGGLGLAAPLLLYLYLPLRAAMRPAFDQFRPDTLEGFANLVLAGPYSGSLVSLDAGSLPGRLGVLGSQMLTQLGWLGLALALLGGLTLLVRNPKSFFLLAFFLGAMLAHALIWNLGDVRDNVVKYLAPASLVLALWIGLGACALVRLPLLAKEKVLPPQAAALAAILACIILALSFPYSNLGYLAARQTEAYRPLDIFRQDLNGGYLARRLVMNSLPQVAEDAVIVADWEQATAYWYFQLVEGLKPGVAITYPTDWEREIASHGDRPVYLVRNSPTMKGKKLTMDGSIARVVAEPQVQPPHDLVWVDANFGNKLRLLGYVFLDRRGERVPSYDPRADVLSFVLYWQALTRMEGDYSVSVRLTDESGRLWAQNDNHHPVLSGYPTRDWDIGEVVGDYYELPFRTLSRGDYRIEVVVYRTVPAGWQNLKVVEARGAEGEERLILLSGVEK